MREDSVEKVLKYLIMIIALITVIGCLVGCTTKRELYLISVKECDCPKNEISVNRYKVPFSKADSAFTQKLREASKEAARKTNIQLYGE